MKTKLIYVFLFISIGIKAQEYKLFVASTETSIQLKWLSKKTDFNASFDLFRKENGSSWQKINDKPIAASPLIKDSDLKSSKNQFPNDENYTAYIKYRNNKETSANKQAYANYSLVLASVFDNGLAKHLGIYFEDKSASVGKKYQYKLVSTSIQQELSVSNEIQLGEKPAAPTEIKATQANQDVNLTWKTNEDFIGYNVYRNGEKVNQEAVLPNSEKGLGYAVDLKDENVKSGIQKYFVTGITYLNSESKASSEIAIEVKDLIAPTSISDLTITRKETEVELKWKASKDKKAVGYFIYKSTDKGKTYKKLNATALEVKTESYIDKQIAEITGAIQYSVETIDASGNARKSNPKSVFVPDHQAPEAPKSVTSKSESGKITLTWSANPEKDLLGYRIYRGLKNNDENSMLLLNSKPQLATTFIDTFPKKANTKLIYKVAALDQSFNESKKAELWVQLPNVTPPNAPMLKEAILKDNKVTLRWNLLTNEAIMSYDVFRLVGDKKEKLNATAQLQDTFVDDKIAKNTLYEYYIQAVDSSKLVSKSSNSLYVSTSESVEKKSIKLLASQDARSKKVVLEIVGIKPEEVQRTQLFRKTGLSGFKIISFVLGNEPFVDSTSEPGKIYQYYLEVVDFNEIRYKSEITSFNNP